MAPRNTEENQDKAVQEQWHDGGCRCNWANGCIKELQRMDSKAVKGGEVRIRGVVGAECEEAGVTARDNQRDGKGIGMSEFAHKHIHKRT